jgi:hypothetical protein
VTCRRRWAGTTVAILIGVTCAMAFPADKSSRTLPQDLRATLDREYPGWRFATISDEDRRLLEANDSQEWVQGDYDGDGKIDYVVQIVRPGSPQPDQLTVALLRRSKGFERHTLGSGVVDDNTFLHPVHKGEELYDFETGRKFPSPADAIVQLYDEKAAVTYLFEKDHFRKIISAD